MKAPPSNCLTTGCEKILDRREGRWLLASVYQEQGRFREAERMFQEILFDFPAYVQAWVGLGHVYLAQRRHDSVEYSARQLDKCHCGGAYAATLRAEDCMARTEMQRARELIDKAIELAPKMVWPRMVLAEWLEANGHPLEACIAAHRDVLRMSPGNAFTTSRLDILARRQVVSVPLWTSIIA
jgi:Tfp pilus assembly protein PilF